MARSRNIKPGFFKNEQLVELPYATRLLFIGLWTIADREGRLEDRPKRIKMELFPADDLNVERALNELHHTGFIYRYKVDGGAYIQIITFAKHQSPHHKEPPSTIPKPETSPRLLPHATDGEPETSPRLDPCFMPCESETFESTLTDENPRQDRDKSEQAPDEPGSSRADSLIPDSLIPESGRKAMSGGSRKPPPANGHRAPALEVLGFLNEKTGRNYQPVKANVDLIAARLKEGATVDDCMAVIAKKFREWWPDDKMRDYLRPATLFNAQKFAQYRGELVDG